MKRYTHVYLFVSVGMFILESLKLLVHQMKDYKMKINYKAGQIT